MSTLFPRQQRAISPKALLLVAVAISAFSSAALSQTDTWKGGNGDWSNGSLWSLGVPGSSSNVLIDNGDAMTSLVTFDQSDTINNLTVNSGDGLSMNDGTQLNVNGGTISNAGTITINGGNASNAVLNIGANTALSGSGTVTLNSSGGTAIIQGNGFRLTNSNNTIKGFGAIGNGSLALTNAGTIDATQAGLTLTLNGTGGITNTGLLEATNTAVLQVQNTVNNSGGNISANDGTVNLVGADIQGGTLNSLNGGTLGAPTGDTATLDGSTHGALTLSSGSTYTGQFGSTTNVQGTITNNGNFLFSGGDASNSVLNLANNTTLQGSGTVTITSEGGTGLIQGNGFTLTNTNNTIQGYGVIGNGSLALTNAGTIDATQAGLTLTLNGSGGITNTKLLEATNTGVLQIQNTVNNSGGNITANDGTVTLVSADIEGGTLNTLNSGTITAPTGDSATLDGSTHGALTVSAGSTYTGQFGSTTNVLGTINNAGTLQFNGGDASNAVMNLSANTTLQGGGTVTITSEGGTGLIQGNGFTLTNTNNTVQGYGVIGNGSLALTNAGTIDATQSALTLTLNGSGGVTNTNLLEATNTGVLQIQNTINNSGGNITGNGGTVEFIGADIQGGTLNEKNNGSNGGFLGVPTGDSVTLDGSTHGALTLSSGSIYSGQFGSTTNVRGTINNNGSFQFSGGNASNSVLNLVASTTLQGNGKGTVILNSEGGTGIIQGNGFTLTNSNNTIEGFGTIGNGTLTLVNGSGGTILATQSGVPLVINAGGKITNSGTFEVNAGTALQVSTGAFTNFAGTTLTGGTYNTAGELQIDELGTAGGEIVTNAANIILNGGSSTFVDANGNNALSAFDTNASAGKFTINNGRNFTTAGNFTNNGTLTVGSSNSKFDVNGNLTNFSGTTLTGGTYDITGTLQFNGANIVTNAANITLSGTSSAIVNQSAGNGLANFATNASGASFTINGGRNFTTKSNFTNNGTLTVGSGSKFDVNGSLTNFSGTTLTGGIYNLTGTLQFNGANIVTNAANISLSGSTSTIVNQSAVNALANFATNAAGGSFSLASGRNFTTASNFTNNGTLTIGSGTKFDVNGNLTNFSGTTLTGGTYNVSGTLQFNGANIVTNAANLTLSGTSSAIVNQSAVNALAGFATNTSGGTFSLASGRNFTTAGNFSNAGTLNVASGTGLTVGGTGLFTQTAGLTRDDGTLTDSGGLDLNGGSLIGKGTVSGAIDNASGTIDPGDSSTTIGTLTDKGAYTQGASGKLDIAIGGTTAGTQFDQLNSSTADLNGTLNVSLTSGFVPKIGQTFKVMNFNSATGSFSTCSCAINSTEHFSVTVQGTDVLLTVVSGAAAAKVTPITSFRSSSLAASHLGGIFTDKFGLNLRSQPFGTEDNYVMQRAGASILKSLNGSTLAASDTPRQIKSRSFANVVSVFMSDGFHTLMTPRLTRLNLSNNLSLVSSSSAFRMLSVASAPSWESSKKFDFAATHAWLAGVESNAHASADSAFRAPLAMRFENPRSNMLPAHAAHSSARTRTFAAGFTFGLSNLRAMPRPGFSVQ